MCMWRFRGVLIAPGIYWHCGCVALRAYLCSGLSGCQLLRRRPSCSWMSTWSSMRRRRSVRKNVTVRTMDSGQWTVDKRPGQGRRSVRGKVGGVSEKCKGPGADTDSGQWTVENVRTEWRMENVRTVGGVNGQKKWTMDKVDTGQMSTVWFHHSRADPLTDLPI